VSENDSDNALSAEDFAALFKRPPEDAIAYLQAKGITVTWDWHEMLDAAHQREFTAAGLFKVEALQAVRDSLVKNMAAGRTYRDWFKGITDELGKQGLMGRHELLNPETGEVKTLAPWRLRTIYQTNMQSAHMAGRWAQMKEATESHPYWQYVAVMDSRTRPAHRALNGLTCTNSRAT
jgi:SPP1 gp7 family putative phage head morphogenesis protein